MATSRVELFTAEPLPDGGARLLLPRHGWPERWLLKLALPVGFIVVALGFAAVMGATAGWSAVLACPMLMLGMFLAVGLVMLWLTLREMLTVGVGLDVDAHHVHSVRQYRGWSRRGKGYAIREVQGIWLSAGPQPKPSGPVAGEMALAERLPLLSAIAETDGEPTYLRMRLRDGTRPILMEDEPAALEALGQELLEQVRHVQKYGRPRAIRPVTHEAGAKVDYERLILPRPGRGTAIDIEQRPDGLTIHVPAPGLGYSRANRAFIKMGLIFVAIMSGVTAVGVLLWWLADEAIRAQPGTAYWAATLGPIFVLMWLGGAGMLVGAWDRATRRAMIDVMDEGLIVTRIGIFGQRQYVRRREALVDARVRQTEQAVTFVEEGHRPHLFARRTAPLEHTEHVYALRLVFAGEASIDVLPGRDREELAWLARVVRLAAGLEHASVEPQAQVRE